MFSGIFDIFLVREGYYLKRILWSVGREKRGEGACAFCRHSDCLYSLGFFRPSSAWGLIFCRADCGDYRWRHGPSHGVHGESDHKHCFAHGSCHLDFLVSFPSHLCGTQCCVASFSARAFILCALSRAVPHFSLAASNVPLSPSTNNDANIIIHHWRQLYRR